MLHDYTVSFMCTFILTALSWSGSWWTRSLSQEHRAGTPAHEHSFAPMAI